MNRQGAPKTTTSFTRDRCPQGDTPISRNQRFYLDLGFPFPLSSNQGCIDPFESNRNPELPSMSPRANACLEQAKLSRASFLSIPPFKATRGEILKNFPRAMASPGPLWLWLRMHPKTCKLQGGSEVNGFLDWPWHFCFYIHTYMCRCHKYLRLPL